MSGIHFHYRVRAVIVKEGKILVSRILGQDYVFLPGGRIESGEPAEKALLREIKEEIGEESSVRSFLGAIEQGWHEDGEPQQEINLLFEADVPGISVQANPSAKEKGFEYFWVDIQELGNTKIFPEVLPELIKKWVEGDRTPMWGSVFKY